MNRGLWLLIGLQTRGWFRSLTRHLRTVKGALLILVAVGALGLWLWAVTQSPRNDLTSANQDNLRRYGPVFFLVYCVMTVLMSGGKRALYFSPAEVNFLFSGPFTRRQLLVYKITVQALIGLPLSLFFTAVFRIHARWDVAVFVGLYLMFFFLQVFALCVGLLADLIGTKADTRARKLLLFGVIVAGAALLAGASQEPGGLRALFNSIESSTIWKGISAPLGTFIETFLVSPGDWGGLLRWGGLAALVALAFVGVLLLLDAHFLESATVNSERIYSQIQKMRRGEAVSLNWSGLDKARWGMPTFPWWGGVGPIAWRQTTTALRSLGRLGFVVLILAPMALMPLFGGDRRDPTGTLFFVLGMLAWLSMLLSTLVPFDFRGDVDRMEVLKLLPVSSWRLVIGQILTPVMILWLLQLFCLAALWIGGVLDGQAFLGCMTIALPLNVLLFGLDNLLFLWFPSRVFASNPGDFQALGRNVVMIITKMLVLLATFAATGGLGLLVHALSGSLFGALAAGWLILTAFAVTMIPLMALAFQGFDVSRDVPA